MCVLTYLLALILDSCSGKEAILGGNKRISAVTDYTFKKKNI
jgi:hypothetical protein